MTLTLKKSILFIVLMAFVTNEAYSQCGQLTTLYAGNNGQDGIMFDVTASQSIVVTSFDIDAYGNTHDYEIYYKAGSHVGSENNAGAWTLLGSANNVAGNPRNTPTTVPITVSVAMCAGETHAFYITSTGSSGSISYTNGTGVGNVAAADANIQVREGTGKDYPYNTSFTPRIPNLTVYYDCTQSCCLPPTMASTPTSCTSACDGTATATVGAGGVPPYSFQWDASAGNQTTQTATNLCAGTYTVDVTDATGCVASSTVTVSAGSQSANATINPAGPFCESDPAVTLTAAEPGGTWSGPGITNPSTGTFNPLVAGGGQHTITYTIPGTCGDSQTTTITVNPQQDATISPAGPFCLTDQPVLLNAADPGGIWSGTGIINSTTGVFDPATAGVGTWTILYQITGNCGSFESRSITVQASSDATITSAGPFCANAAPVTLSTNGTGGTWSGTGITDPVLGTFDPSIAGPGSTTVTYTIPGNCGDSDDQVININPAADASITPAGPFCLGDAPVNLTAADPGGTWAGSGITNSSAGTFNPAAAGLGTWTIIYNIAGSCGDFQTTQITVTNGADASIDPVSPMCTAEDPDTLNAVDAGGTWTGPGIINQIAGVFDPEVAGPGTHTITYTLSGSCGDVGTVQIFVIESSDASITPITDTICTTDAPFNWVSADGGGTWGGYGITDPFTGAFNPAQVPPGNWTVNYSISGFCGDSDSQPFVVAEGGDPTIDPVNPLCAFAPEFDMTADIAGGTWSGTGIIDPVAGTFNPTIAGAGNWTITYALPGPCGGFDTEVVQVSSPISLTTSLDQQANCGQPDGIASVSASGGTVANDYSYSWSTSPVQSTATVTGLTPGVYTVSVTDDQNCSATSSVNVTSTIGFNASISALDNVSCYQACDGEATVATSAGSISPLSYSWNSTPAQTTATASNLCEGTYDVTVTDNVGCTSTTSVTVTEPTQLTASAGATVSPICGSESSSLIAGVSGGTPPYVFTWTASPADPSLDGSAQNPVVSPTATTTYEVTVTDGNGCTITDQVTIDVSPALVLTGTLDQESNCGQPDGIVSVSVTGGTIANDYGYSWNSTPAQTTATATGLAPGIYQVNVTDDVGCMDSTTVEVTTTAGFIASISASSDMSCFQVCDGQATAEASIEAVAPLAYSWNTTPTQTTATATGLCAGTYDVEIIDNAGCTATTSVTINEPTELTVTAATSETQLCTGGTSDLTAAANGGSAPISYNWVAVPADPSLTAATQNPTVSPTATTTYTVTATDASGCTATDQVTVDVSSALVLNATIAQESNCGQPDGSVTVSASGGIVANDYSYSWDSNPVQTTATATSLAPATYTVTVTDDLGCSETASVLLTSTAGFTADILASSDASCYQNCDGQATVEASTGSVAPITYSWNTSPAQTTALATGLCAGTYDVTVTDNTGCSATNSVTISEPVELTASAVATDASCYQSCDGEAIASASAGAIAPITYSWNTTPAQTTATATNLCAGTYDVQITDNAGCTATTSVTINEPTAFTVAAASSETQICVGGTSDLTVTATGGSAPLSYNWSATPTDPSLTASSQNPTVSPLVSTTYTVTATDANGCTATDQVTVDVSTALVLNATVAQASNCGQPDGSVTVAVSGGIVANDYSYSWNSNPVQTTATATNLAPATYTVTITDDLGCSETASILLASTAGFTADIITSSDASCFQVCDGDATVAASAGSVAPVTYSWNTSPAQTSATATGLCAGTYDVTVTDNTGCSATNSVTILEPTELTASITASETVICSGQTSDLTLTTSGGTQPLTYAWMASPADPSLIASAQNPTVSPTASTTYTVTVTDAGGCTTTSDITIDISPTISVTTTLDQESSCAQSNGEATATASGGTVANDYSYSWNTNPVQTTATATNLSPGVYTVTVTDDLGCSATETVDVTAVGGFLPSITAFTDVTCFQACDGTATADAGSGSIAPITYVWNTTPVQNTATATNLCGGTYEVAISDAAGCTDTIEVTIAEPAELTVAASASETTICAGATSDLSAAANGGSQPYATYTWSSTPNDPSLVTSSQNPTVTPTANTTYTVEVEDANGCTATNQVAVDVGGGLSLTTTMISGSNCNQSDGAVAVSATGGVVANDYSYSWDSNPVQTTATATGLPAGTYTVTVTDDNGCSATATIDVTGNTGFTASITSSTDVSCYQLCDGEATVEASAGATAPITYSWNTQPAQSTATATGLCAGTYETTITDAVGCSETATVTIIEPDEFTAVTSASSTQLCEGSSSDLSATIVGGVAPTSLSWSASPADPTLNTSSSNPTVAPIVNTTYTASVTDANGCIATSDVAVEVSGELLLNTTMDQPSNCGQGDGIVSVSVSGGIVANDYNYSWNSTPAQTTASATGLSAGTYTVTVTDDIGCSETADVEVTATAGFTASISASSDALCFQECDGEATVTTSTGSVAPLSYTWNSTPTQNGAIATNLCAGTYDVTVTDAVGCIATASATIWEPTELVVTSTSSLSSICIGETSDLTAMATGGTAPYQSYSWTATPTDASLNAAAQNPTVTPESTTNYEVTVTDANGCEVTSQVLVEVLPALSLDVVRPLFNADTAICPYDEAILDVQASGGDGNYTYYLQPELSQPATLPMSVQPNETTTYVFVVEDGCSTPSATAQSTVTVHTLPEIVFEGDVLSGCHVHAVQFTDNTTPAPVTHSWNFGDSQSNSNTSPLSDPYHTFSNPGLFDISLSIETAQGCVADTTYLDYVEVFPLPNANFSSDPNVTNMVDPRITYTDQSTGDIESWYWDFGTGDTSWVQNPQYTYLDTGVFITWLTVTTVDGCIGSTRGEIRIEPSFTFYVPNAFTPNGDERNDYFRGYGEGVDWETYQMSIYNRWGEEIYYTNSIDQPWDGTFKGLPVEMATYVYVIHLNDVNGNDYVFRDGVSLIR